MRKSEEGKRWKGEERNRERKDKRGDRRREKKEGRGNGRGEKKTGWKAREEKRKK